MSPLKGCVLPRNRCFLNHDLVLKMAGDGACLNDIGRAVGSKGASVRLYLERNGIHKEWPKTRPGNKNPKWRGGRTVTKNGYVLLYKPEHPHAKFGCYVWEHRYVMEQAIGRLLLPKEVVHHKDGNPANNAIDNLQLFSENREHLAHELKGRCPNWTPDGLARIQKGVEKAANLKRGKTRPEIAQHVQPSP